MTADDAMDVDDSSSSSSEDEPSPSSSSSEEEDEDENGDETFLKQNQQTRTLTAKQAQAQAEQQAALDDRRLRFRKLWMGKMVSAFGDDLDTVRKVSSRVASIVWFSMGNGGMWGREVMEGQREGGYSILAHGLDLHISTR